MDFSDKFTPSRLFWPHTWDFNSSFTPNSVFWPYSWDFNTSFTPSRLFWPQTTTGWLSITLQPIQSLYSRPFPILLLNFPLKTEGCHKSQDPWQLEVYYCRYCNRRKENINACKSCFYKTDKRTETTCCCSDVRQGQNNYATINYVAEYE